MAMDFLPIYLDIKLRRCLVVGGGEVAQRKIKLLLEAGGCVTVVSPVITAEVDKLAKNQSVSLIRATFEEAHMDDARLVIAATDDVEVNARVSRLAQESGIPVNVVDAPELCSFIMPSIIDRSPVLVAVSSGGSSPVLARLLRARLETLIPASYGRLAALVKGFRETVKKRFQDTLSKRRFWEKILQGPIAEMMFSGREKEARDALEGALHEAQTPVQHGEVYLVGAGPGDPDLLTFRALRLIQQADVIVYDRLVAKAVLELARRDAERIYVGKEQSNHAMRQEQINELLAELALKGKRVLRLKGGDPFIFGRGGEEIDTLMEKGVSFQVVPGITAAAGCAAYAGIPLTHRDYAQSVVFATGHLKDHTINLNWQALAQPGQTIVFYMGLNGLPQICRQLQQHGMDGHTPVALIQQGTTIKQQVHTGTLADMEHFDDPDIKPPTLIIVGEVVRLREKFSWFEPVLSDQERGNSMF